MMPAAKLACIKGAIKECASWERNAVSTHAITNSASRSTTYTLAILKEDLEKKYAKMSQGKEIWQICTTRMPGSGSTICSPPPWARAESAAFHPM